MIPKCSLLIPCYNAAAVLPRLWENVLAQTRPFDEVICFDDGSTDNTVEVINGLGARLVTGSANRGPAFARNALAREASGDWLHFHDADDLVAPRYLELALAAGKDADVVSCNADWIEENSRALLIARRYRQEDLTRDPVRSLLSNPMGVISALYRKEAFFEVGGFDESLRCLEDGDLNTRLAAAGKRFAVVEDVLAVSLRHTNGASADALLCARSRLRTLKRYSLEFPAKYYQAIAAEAEKTAGHFLDLGVKNEAVDALQLCHVLGVRTPITNSRILRGLGLALSPLNALRLQLFVRRRVCANRSLRVALGASV
jgi:glycosyltransferase involved in cell wall biosynthesis